MDELRDRFDEMAPMPSPERPPRNKMASYG